MQETNYSVWDWKVNNTSAERVIYYNDFLVYVSFRFTTRNFPAQSNWTQIGSMTVGDYPPESNIYIDTHLDNLRFRITNSGQVQYKNTGSALSAPSISVGIMYPRKNSLP